MYCVIALVPVACGTRKVATDISKTSDKGSTETSTDLQKESSGGMTTQEDAFNQNTKTNETTEVTKDTYLDKDTGKPTRVTEITKTGKSSEVTISRQITVKNTFFHELEKLKIKTNTVYIKTTYNKTKKTESERNGLFWMIGVVCVIGLAFLLKPWAR